MWGYPTNWGQLQVPHYYYESVMTLMSHGGVVGGGCSTDSVYRDVLLRKRDVLGAHTQ